jgi:23S rRNA (cytidine2498-2'-O)-methyltransferase
MTIPSKINKPFQPKTATLLGYCRAGFEMEVIAEWAAVSRTTPSATNAVSGSGFALATFAANAARGISHVLGTASIFSRAVIVSHADVITLGTRDRVTPIVDATERFLDEHGVTQVSSVWVEYPDTNDGKRLTKLALALEERVTVELLSCGRIGEHAPKRLHVFMTGKEQARVGFCDLMAATASPWRLGIPRIRMPKDAPSRSTAKLAEAIHYFLRDNDKKLLQPEMHAVDLGAAPGGWTWQLVHRGLHVMAVDNGAMKGDMVDNALVRHLREDGFRFQPKKPLDWMVCDIVDSPSRIATLVGRWLSQGWARHTIFNLKLPMKKRFDEVERCRAIIEEALGERRGRFALQFKHLFHDREEITGYAGLISRRR